MRRVAVITAHPSERHLVEPVYNALVKRGDVTASLIVFDHTRRFDYLVEEARERVTTDVALVSCDRTEMVYIAAGIYGVGIPMFHFFAGIGYTGTLDDTNRRILSSFSSLMLCEDKAAKERLVKSGEEPWRIHVVGTTHLENIEFDDSVVPEGRFDLVFLNPNPGDPQDTMRALNDALQQIKTNVPTLWIEPTDEFPNFKQWMQSTSMIPRNVRFIPRQSRPAFLALMRRAHRFISNSSATTYEWPLFGTGELVNPSKRNAARTTQYQNVGGIVASEKVASLLATYPLATLKVPKAYNRMGRPRYQNDLF